MYYVHRALTVFSLLALLAAAWWSIRLARADALFRKRTPADVARAIELEPENGEYLATLALQAEYTGQDSTQLWEEVARLNPRASAPRIRLGLAAELRGDANQAERWLQEAFSVDRQFETRWTLANFYFRQGKPVEFWMWIRSALEMSYGDRVAAFDLCWQQSDDANEILTRAIPDRREVVAAYLAYVLSHHRQAAIAGAANRLAKIRGAEDLPLLYTATDAVLDPDLWQALGNPRPDGITHPNFEEPHIGPSVGHGFDWRFADVDGVTHSSLQGAHRIRFSGQQPETCELLRQVLGGLRPGAAYILHWTARTQGLASPTGITWRIAGNTGELTASEDWSSGTLTFTTDSDHAVLVLAYRRPQGQVRAEGYLDLRQVVTSSQE
jgi:tetratricopeptide (TPR) repeat protein